MTDATCLRAVDIHVHAVPRPLIDRAARGEFPGVEVLTSDPVPLLGFPDMEPSPPMPPSMLDGVALAGAASGQHIAVQLLGPWTDLLGYTLPEDASVEWSHAYNEALAEECADSDHQLPMATVPLTFPSAAVDVLKAARDLGCHGAMIGTDIPGLSLGSPELDPVWEAAAALEMPILLHPTHLHIPAELRTNGLRNAVGRAAPTALALTQLVYGGALDRHPGLRFVACHGGGGFPGVAPRVLRNHDLGWSGTTIDVAASIARLYFDSVVLDPAMLRHLVEDYGADRVLLGSDLPYPWEPDPAGTLLRAELGPTDTAAIAGTTARTLYRLPPAADCADCSRC